jgi:chromosome segregation ATPase
LLALIVRLSPQLSFDDHVARDDPFFNEQTAEKLSNLYLQGNNFMIRLELERKEVGRLNALIQAHEAILAQQKMKLYELAALDHNHAILLSRVRKMEHDIDRRLVKLNEKLNRNRQLREAIDAHRAERARMDDMYTKISSETMAKRQLVARVSDEVDKLRQEIQAVEEEIEGVRQEGDKWETECDRRAASLLEELKEIALHQKDAEELVDVDKYKFLGENDIMKTVSETQESVVQSRAKRSKWKSGQAKVSTDAMLIKYQENRTYIEKIHEVSGTKTVSEMIDAFNNQYPSSRAVAPCSSNTSKLGLRSLTLFWCCSHRGRAL